jgi:hypothetical protein
MNQKIVYQHKDKKYEIVVSTIYPNNRPFVLYEITVNNHVVNYATGEDMLNDIDKVLVYAIDRYNTEEVQTIFKKEQPSA